MTHRDMMSPSSGVLYCGDGSCFDLAGALKTIFDPYGKSFSAIESIHRHIHLGEGFKHMQRYSIASTGTLSLLLKTGSKVVHFMPVHYCANQDDLEIDFFEAVTVSGNGTPELAVNLNRLSSNVPTLELYREPSGLSTASATALFKSGILGEKKAGGEVENLLEWVLKKETRYAMTIKNNAAQTAKLLVQWYWYEPGGEG